MKIFRLLLILMAVSMSINLSSCSDDNNEEVLSPDENNDVNSDPIYELVKNNISATVSYGDYGWNFTIKSNLMNAFPGKTIYYGVESGYGDYLYYEHFKFDRDYIQKNDGNGNMSISYPVFVGNEYGYEQIYWYSYKTLKAKKEKGESLSSDERDLWNEIIKAMNAKEYKAKSEFCGRLYAQFDNNRYIYHTFGQSPNEASGGDSTNGGSTNGNGSSSTGNEKPEIGLEDYTCYTTSITLKYRIYNQDKAKVTSAKGYYGKTNASRSVSGTVTGSLISIRLTGLNKGTTYYIKCSATGAAGTTTSDVVKLQTEY